MGITRFFQFLRKKFPNIITDIKFGDIVAIDIDNFGIDFNAIIHPCAAKVYGYGDKHRSYFDIMDLSNESPAEKKQREQELFKTITSRLEAYVNLIRPKKRFLIYGDGIAGLSKLQQQRQRRFKSATSKTPEDLKIFDTCCITPGTEFMCRLSGYIDQWILQKKKTDTLWKQMEVQFSDHLVVNEGEHKIIRFFEKEAFDEVNCVNSVDADLFMLSLASQCPHIFLLREDMFDHLNDFHMVHIAEFRQDLIHEMKPVDLDYEEECLINDFVLMGFFVGNDFVHILPTLRIQDGAFDLLFSTYKKNFQEKGHLTYLENKKGKINFQSLFNFFKKLASPEYQIIEDQYRHSSRYPNTSLIASVTEVYTDSTTKPVLDLDKYKKLYYRKMSLDVEDPQEMKEYIHKYLEALCYILEYYSYGIPTYRWNFPYSHTPFPSDIIRFGTDYKATPFVFEPPVTPFQQLLCVIPPVSKNLLPEEYHALMTSENSPIIDFYPSDFETDMEGVDVEYEGVICLPPIHFSRVQEAYDQIPKKDYKRNGTGQLRIYK